MTRKYDCEKTRDFIHEWARYTTACAQYTNLEPIEPWEKDAIERIQKWSDEHPEPPKLTKRDYSFLNCFSPVDKYIRRQYGVLSIIWYDPMITIGAMEIPIDVTMFKCVEKGQKWSFEDLLKLEVDVSDTNVGKMEGVEEE